jgi:hypothetical protein
MSACGFAAVPRDIAAGGVVDVEVPEHVKELDVRGPVQRQGGRTQDLEAVRGAARGRAAINAPAASIATSRRKIRGLIEVSFCELSATLLTAAESALVVCKCMLATVATLQCMSAERRELQVSSRAEWRTWLEEHHETEKEIWLLIPLKNSGHPGPPYAEAVEVALCFGWIDGQMAKAQGDGWKRQRFTPRRPKGNWAASNKARVEPLIAAGEMHESGMREVDAAKADGRWDAV